MKVLQINKFFYPHGGAERHFFDVMNLLEEKGHEVIPFSMHDDRNVPSPYSKYFVSNVSFGKISPRTLIGAGRVLYSFEARKKLTQLIRDTKPDVAHVHLMYHHLSPSVLLALRDANIPVVMTIHDWQALCPNYSLYANGKVCTDCKKKSYRHVFFDKATQGSYLRSSVSAVAGWFHHHNRWYEDLVDRYIAPSHFAQELFYEYGWPKEQVVHIPHFLSVPPLTRTKEKKQPYLLYAGRLYSEKGIDRLVELWGKEQLAYQLQIAGTGPLEDNIRSLISKYGLVDRVTLRGFLQQDELQETMRTAAGVIAPSLVYETFGLSVLEAFGQGTGVLVNETGAFTELSKESEAGLLFSWQKGNVAERIRQYMDHEKEWSVYGKRGQKFAQQFTAEAYYDKIIALYTSLQKHG